MKKLWKALIYSALVLLILVLCAATFVSYITRKIWYFNSLEYLKSEISHCSNMEKNNNKMSGSNNNKEPVIMLNTCKYGNSHCEYKCLGRDGYANVNDVNTTDSSKIRRLPFLKDFRSPCFRLQPKNNLYGQENFTHDIRYRSSLLLLFIII